MTVALPASVAVALRTARVARGMTQADVARLVGVHRSVVSRWEDGTLRPSRSVVLLLHDLLPEVELDG